MPNMATPYRPDADPKATYSSVPAETSRTTMGPNMQKMKA
jgi:hypothetical protein